MTQSQNATDAQRVVSESAAALALRQMRAAYAAMDREVVRLADGDLGYAMAPLRYDECLRAAIATVTQTPIERVPDPQLDERLEAGENVEEIDRDAWSQLRRWAAGRGLRIVIHHKLPARRRRWIGVVPDPAPEPFGDHCLVMCHGELYFDPAVGVVPPPWMKLWRYTPSDIAWGMSFERRRSS